MIIQTSLVFQSFVLSATLHRRLLHTHTHAHTHTHTHTCYRCTKVGNIIDSQVLGRSHRSKLGKGRLALAISETKRILGIPDDYLCGNLTFAGCVAITIWLFNSLPRICPTKCVHKVSCPLPIPVRLKWLCGIFLAQDQWIWFFGNLLARDGLPMLLIISNLNKSTRLAPTTAKSPTYPRPILTMIFASLGTAPPRVCFWCWRCGHDIFVGHPSFSVSIVHTAPNTCT